MRVCTPVAVFLIVIAAPGYAESDADLSTMQGPDVPGIAVLEADAVTSDSVQSDGNAHDASPSASELLANDSHDAGTWIFFI